MNPQELKHTLSSGLLTFPVTDFDAAGNFRPATYAQRLVNLIWSEQYKVVNDCP
jgi:hypothetical protein